MSLYDELMTALGKNGVKYRTEKIRQAYELAAAAHSGQKRDSGEDYIVHPVKVAVILSEYGSDTEAIAAALLHDVIEDTEITYRQIKKDFGSEVAELVSGVTKLGKIPYSSREEQQVENLRKMFLAMAKDIRVILIKLADRLHNIRTLQYRAAQKQRDTALETMEVYAPIAHRLGMQRMKHELEDVSLKYLDPYGYMLISDNLEKLKFSGEHLLGNVKNMIASRLAGNGENVQLEGRVKHIYSIYRKMFFSNKEFNEIYDLYAVRIIVDTVNECYNALGIVHDLFKPIPGRFKDYISTPKPNMYQSLHTTVIGREGVPVEVQIRTWEMHRTAELGIAAHWKYKSGIFGKNSIDAKLEWVRDFLEIQQEQSEPEDFLRTLKIDFFADEVFVFTPKGDVINLPLGSTVIDFAYKIHSDVGNHMTGATVNGKQTEFSYKLANGDIVEIESSGSSQGPKRDWLKIAKTNEARNKIRQFFKKERREENIATGREELDREIRRNGMRLTEEQKERLLSPILEKHGLSAEELYNQIGYGGIFISKILPKLKDEYVRLREEEAAAGQEIYSEPLADAKISNGIIVEGLSNCLTRLARCCSPLPGDKIVGFITRGFGVSVHKADCVNILNCTDENRERLVNARWASERGDFSVNLSIRARQRLGMVAEITAVVANMHLIIRGLTVRELKNERTHISINLDVNSAEHLALIMSRLARIDGVEAVERSHI